MTKFDLDKLVNQAIKPTFGDDAFPPGAETDANIIEPLFVAAMTENSSDFLESIYSWWEVKGFLTASQYEKLCEIAEIDPDEEYHPPYR